MKAGISPSDQSSGGAVHRIRRSLRFAISLVIVSGLVYYLVLNWDSFRVSEQVAWYHIALLVVAIAGTQVVSSIQVLLLLRAGGLRIGFWENLALHMTMGIVNYIPMQAGTLVRFYYLKRVHGVDYARFAGVIGLRLSLMLATTGLLGCIAIIGPQEGVTRPTLLLLVVFCTMLLAPLAIFSFATTSFSTRYPAFNRMAEQFSDAFVRIHQQPGMAFKILLLLLIQYALLACRLAVGFDVVGVNIGLWKLLMLAPLTVLVTSFSFTPGSLGFREWTIGLASALVGLQLGDALFAGSIDRVVMMMITFSFGSLAGVFIWTRMSTDEKCKTRSAGRSAGYDCSE